MEYLPVSDVSAIVELLSGLVRLPQDPQILQRHVVRGITRLVDADACIWSKGRHGLGHAPPVPLMWLHEGWTPPEISAFMEVASAPEFDELFQFPMGRLFTGRQGEHLTRSREQVAPDAAWYGSKLYRETYVRTGMGPFIMTLYTPTRHTFSAIGFWRRRGREPFEERERCLVHVVAHSIDWLHEEGFDVPAVDRAHGLSPRQRQVLFLLLSGDSRKQIADKLNISQHTVTDYMKMLHKHFGVSSRGELLAQFVSGGGVKSDCPRSQ